MQSPKLNYLLWGSRNMTPPSHIDQCRLGRMWGTWEMLSSNFWAFLFRGLTSLFVETLALVKQKSVTQMGWVCTISLSVASLEAGWWWMVTMNQNLGPWSDRCQNGSLTVALCTHWVLQAIVWYELRMPLQLEKVWKETHPTTNRQRNRTWGAWGGVGSVLALSVYRISSFHLENIFLDYMYNS